jgi:hypothetical protein
MGMAEPIRRPLVGAKARNRDEDGGVPRWLPVIRGSRSSLGAVHVVPSYRRRHSPLATRIKGVRRK